VVEDEAVIRELLSLTLESEGFAVEAVATGQEAMQRLQQGLEDTTRLPELLLLDLMLPEVNGLDICRYLRSQGAAIPVLILSAKDSELDRVVGLEIGADDYLTKPFGMRELVARCRALLRRAGATAAQAGAPVAECLTFQDLQLFPQECRVLMDGEELNLAPKEFRLLELFMRNPRRVWSREQLLEKVWGHDFMGDSKTVDVHIRWLREKIEAEPSAPRRLLTVRGFGYRLG
jgi:two-component system phosphate regulon response regulator PhoB